MAENILAELGASNRLLKELKTEEIIRILTELRVPEVLYQDIKQGTNFLTALKKWSGLNSYQFYQSLNSVRPDLVPVACRIKWLCVSSPEQTEYKEEEVLSVKTLIELMKSEISKANWELIYMAVTGEAGENINFEITLNKLLENGLIDRDLSTLKGILFEIDREDLIEKLQQYQNAFRSMEEEEFESKFKREVNNQAKELKQWEMKLREFVKVQYKQVKQLLGDDESVSLSEVFVDLTILKQKPKEINMTDETTYNEIAYLRKIANKEVEIIPVDFTEEIITYKQTEPEIWCLIGNPGCGKTFLAKRTALRFSSSELINIQYSISIPCRSTDWHAMESTRYENELEIETEYISKWLCLGLPKGPNWPKDLAKHLTESDGEGLLLIIDGLDEFTRKIPFGKTLLCLLLTRQSLTKSTIILTSRPGAWTDISSLHELNVDRYYQVLGFSPENRDLYFMKQIMNETKLRACWDLMERHDEMKQLSLIPVNASLFAALLKGEGSTSISTLSKLYYELTLYMIRRELSRMGLQEFSRVALISDLHTDIQECLKGIGFIAFLGVANRDLASEENVPLIMGQEEYPSNCLGLAHEHYKKEAVGLIKKVWTFAHLSMQEFTAAHWLSTSTWTEQCYSIRYISHSSENFSLFKMLVRFLCGILSHKSAAILSVMYRYLTPQPAQINNMPMMYQFSTDNFLFEDWKVFTEFYLQLTAILFETNSNSIINRFAYFRQFLPNPIYLYFTQTVSPNEWICFLQSLQLLSQIQLIYIKTEYINPKQFIDLIERVKVFSLHYLALEFHEKDTPSILEYFKDKEFPCDTKIRIALYECDLTHETAVELFPLSNQNLFNLYIKSSNYTTEFQILLANQLSTLEYVSLPESRIQVFHIEKVSNELFEHVYTADYDILIPGLCQATQLIGLQLIVSLSANYSQLLIDVLPHFSNIQEIRIHDYSLIPALSNLSNLTYLKIDSEQRTSEHCPYLLQLIFENRNTLKYLYLYSLYKILTDMDIFLNCIALCTNLVELSLYATKQTSKDISLWSDTVNNMKALVVLNLQSVRLYDAEFESLCAGLAYHTNIRKLWVTRANLTSPSCDTLIQLIPTITQLERLNVSNFRRLDEEAYKLLQQTAKEYSIKFKVESHSFY